MNITFLIGNGFDLNLGLKTGYKDFYKYYLEKCPDDLIAKSISNNYEYWSDLELGLGKFVKNISNNEVDNFFDSKENLDRSLAEYLKNEESRIDWKSISEIEKDFHKKLLNFFKDFNEIEKDIFLTYKTKTQKSLHYSFITFNYTNVLDNIVAESKKRNPFASHNGYNDIIDTPLHIHGTLSDGLIVGVDNIHQIENNTIKTNICYSNYLTKTSMNETLGKNRIDKAKKILDESCHICLYGLSIGETDKTWWQYLVEWLSKDKHNRLVIFARDKELINNSATHEIRFRDKKRNFFLKMGMCLDDVQQNALQEQIIVVPNSDIFTLPNLKLKEFATN